MAKSASSPVQVDVLLSVLGLNGPPCIDHEGWRGSLGSCLDYERSGLCFDGRHRENASDAALQCCACGGGRSLSGEAGKSREQCLAHDEQNLLQAARLAQAMEPLCTQARWVEATRRQPGLYGWRKQRFAAALEPIAALLQGLLYAFLDVARRLLLLGLCARVCDATLLAVPDLLFAQRELLDSAPGEAFAHASEVTMAARRACSGVADFAAFVAMLSEWAQHIDCMANQVVALMLNLYFADEVRWSAGGFVVDDRPRDTKRWGVLHSLLVQMGCAAQRCDFVEVGVYAGETSAHLLVNLPHLHVHGVDPFVPSDEYPHSNGGMFERALQLYKSFGDRAQLHRNTSRAVAATIGKVDLVFIDGSHAYDNVADDLAVWAPFTCNIAGHDLNLRNGDVARAVFEWAAGRVVRVLPDAVWLVTS
mmetsp:Transcript_118444/g.334892  ORF Transcript_118444/g.334892 Transcript_118444/m.334892 type:complete len:421 (-) Transcript_118444:45-1307(-)